MPFSPTHDNTFFIIIGKICPGLPAFLTRRPAAFPPILPATETEVLNTTEPAEALTTSEKVGSETESTNTTTSAATTSSDLLTKAPELPAIHIPAWPFDPEDTGAHLRTLVKLLTSNVHLQVSIFFFLFSFAFIKTLIILMFYFQKLFIYSTMTNLNIFLYCLQAILYSLVALLLGIVACCAGHRLRGCCRRRRRRRQQMQRQRARQRRQQFPLPPFTATVESDSPAVFGSGGDALQVPRVTSTTGVRRSADSSFDTVDQSFINPPLMVPINAVGYSPVPTSATTKSLFTIESEDNLPLPPPPCDSSQTSSELDSGACWATCSKGKEKVK